MSSIPSEVQNFTGTYANLLEKFSALMDKLWQEHLTSPTIAGSEKFYAWGNIDYAVVMSEHKFDDVVDIKTKIGSLEIKKDSDGKFICQIVEDKPLKKKDSPIALSDDPAEILEKTILALNHYYYSNLR
jgi:hypothetical protein